MKFLIFNFPTRIATLRSRSVAGGQFSNKAFTLIEVLVGISLISIVFFGIFGAFQLGIMVVGQSRAAVTAITIINQRMEGIRNLSYEDVGVVGGIPAGHILPQEIITRNRIHYTVETRIVYIDDPFDKLAPDDDIPTDYKRVEIRISWAGPLRAERVLVTDIVPRDKEEEKPGGGVLAISVSDAQGIRYCRS